MVGRKKRARQTNEARMGAIRIEEEARRRRVQGPGQWGVAAVIAANKAAAEKVQDNDIVFQNDVVLEQSEAEQMTALTHHSVEAWLEEKNELDKQTKREWVLSELKKKLGDGGSKGRVNGV
uniref:Uncharacterized protein n=1 Tax=Pyramimonas obovata TaxID=1411642 RepID=A0A7S0RQR0_9CHLO